MRDTKFYIIIFCDLVGSSDVASELTTDKFANEYITSFYSAGQLAKGYPKWNNKSKSDLKYNFQGDEIILFKKTAKNDLITDVENALSFAYTLKLYWLLSPYTVDKVLDIKPPREIAIGIHTGYISELRKFKGKIASYDINLAKRIETISRKGNSSNIYASNYVVETFNKLRERNLKNVSENRIKELKLLNCAYFDLPKPPEELKGIPTRVYVSELVPELTSQNNIDIIRRALVNREKNMVAFKAMKVFKNKIFNTTKKYSIKKYPIKRKKGANKYLKNLIYLSKCSGNLWFKFNTLYITSAISEHYKLNFKEQIDELYEDLIAFTKGDN